MSSDETTSKLHRQGNEPGQGLAPAEADEAALPREVELKLVPDGVSADEVEAHLRDKAEVSRAEILNAVYYDTADHRLRAAGITLRVRERNRDFTLTVKRSDGGGSFDRAEWEHPVSGQGLERAALAATPAASILDEHEAHPIFSVGVQRHVHDLVVDGARIEVAVDRGRIGVGRSRKKLSFEEVELELKNGPVAGLFALARDLSAATPLRLGVLGKADRGFSLVDGTADRSRKAEAVRVQADMDAGAAFRAIAHACLRHMRVNEDLLRARRDVEALHQMRVALRRLRAALSLFREVVADGAVDGLRSRLKLAAEPLGRARNLDVFMASTLADERARRPDAAELAALATHVERERQKAYDDVLESLGSAEWRSAVLDFVAWTETGPWRTAALPAREQPVRLFAAEILERRRRKIRKRGRHLATMDVSSRHAVRIAAKKLRYGAEFFAGLYEKPKVKKRHKAFVHALSDMQEALGELNDVANADGVLDGLRASAGADMQAVFAAGLMAADENARIDELLMRARAAHAAFADERPFWR